MRPPACSVLFLLAAGLMAGCGGATYDPWLAPEQDFAATVHTVALLSLEVPEEIDGPDSLEAVFDSLLTSELEGAGLRLIPSRVTMAIWGRLVDSVGGYYDPYTGRKDTTRYNPVHREWIRALREDHGADAILFPSVVFVDADLSDWKASWDGTSQRIQSIFAVALRAISEGQNEATAPALSLEVQVEDLDGDVMYVNRGGIEVWEKPVGGRGDGYRPVPRSELFRDASRNAAAVRIALKAMVGANAVARGK